MFTRGWGKAIHLADEIIADADQGGLDEQMALRIKSRALTNKASCEQNMGHLEEAERYYLEGIDLKLVVIIIFQRWRIGEKNAALARFIRENIELSNELNKK